MTRQMDMETLYHGLSKGMPLGKSVVVPFTFTGGAGQPSPLSSLQLQGDDRYAQNLCLTLSPPKAINNSDIIDQAVLANPQSLTSGTITNIESVAAEAAQRIRWDNPYAEIEWGVGGINQRVIADVANGLCVNLSASFVRVRMGVDEGPGDTGSKLYQLACNIGPGWPKPFNAQRTIPLFNFEESGGGIVSDPLTPVPFFAKAVSIITQDVQDAAIYFYRDMGALYQVGSYEFTPNTPGAFPVPNGAYFFQVVLTGESAAGNVSVIFDLAV